MFFPAILAFQEVRLVPDGSLLVHIALILLMIWILNRTFFRPINRVIESRERNKGGRFGEAQEILRSVQEKQDRYNAAMLEARSKGYELITNERTQAVAQRQERIASIKTEVEQKLAQENAELERQIAQARATIAGDAEQLAEKISSSILRA
jgi:F0F1-type ATP synthase membrane subunit b/b'